MKLVTGPAVILDGGDCARLAPLLGRAVRSAVNRGEALDRAVLDVVAAVELGAGRWRASADVRAEGSFGLLELEPADTDVTTAEAGVLLGVTPHRVTQLLRANRLPGVKHGTQWKVDRDGIRRRIEGQGAA